MATWRRAAFIPLSRIREISGAIAEAVAALAYRRGLAEGERPADLSAAIHAYMYRPVYPHHA